MFAIELLFAFTVALALSMLFIPWTSAERATEQSSIAGVFVFFFLILLLSTWAGGVWMTPVGPSLWGVAWLPFVLIGFFVAVLLAAVTEPSRKRYLRTKAGRRVPDESAVQEVAETAASAFGLLFWIVLIASLLAIIAHYFPLSL